MAYNIQEIDNFLKIYDNFIEKETNRTNRITTITKCFKDLSFLIVSETQCYNLILYIIWLKSIYLKNWDIMKEIQDSQSIRYDDLHFHPLYMIELDIRSLNNETKKIIRERFKNMYSLHAKIRESVHVILDYYRVYKTRRIITTIRQLSFILPNEIIEKILSKKLKIKEGKSSITKCLKTIN